MVEDQHRHDISDEFLSRMEPRLPGRKGVGEGERKTTLDL